jgi:hypothetical protein
MGLGLRHAANRPGRSVLAIAGSRGDLHLISVDAFRHGVRPQAIGTPAWYSLLVDLSLPLVHDPNGADGREALGLAAFPDVRVEPFRVRPGDDASCLNLYEPRNPTILGASRAFIESNRFTFQSAIPGSDAERTNPWLLLDRSETGDQGPVVPVVADANSMTYVLHKNLGDDIVIDRGGQPVRLRLVAALSDSILQSELVMSEVNFLQLFPDQEGFERLLVEAPPSLVARLGRVAVGRTSAPLQPGGVAAVVGGLAEGERGQQAPQAAAVGQVGEPAGLGVAAEAVERAESDVFLVAVGYACLCIVLSETCSCSSGASR